MFLIKKHNFLEFSKSLYKTSRMKQFNYQIIFGVKCNSKWGKTNKENPVRISHNLNFGDFLILRKMQENANKIQYVYKAMVVLHICNKILGIPSPAYPGNKNQILMLIKF